jgi:Tfp pilus assembly protein PilZ
MQERRKHPRKNLMSYSQVFELYEGRLIGYLGDLNLRGAMVIGDQAMEVDKKLTLSIQLPELPDPTATRMTLPGRVAWCQPDLSPEFFNIGLEFELVTDAQKAIIESILDNYEFRRDIPNYPPRPAELG